MASELAMGITLEQVRSVIPAPPVTAVIILDHHPNPPSITQLKFASRGQEEFKESDLKGCGGSLKSAIRDFMKELDGDDVKQALASVK